MKWSLFILIGFFAVACQNGAGKEQASYKKEDLGKIQWIEGNWVGMDGAQPFYEIYKMVNDSTLEITSYNWTGTDSTESSRSYIKWQDGYYYLGDSLNWKVTEITDNSIHMVPVRKAANDILWKKHADNSWTAVLKSKKGEKQYRMKPVDHYHK